MRNVRLIVEYDGGNFHGWQAQTLPAVRTVQEELEAVLSRVLREDV
jgi:tRNA pseudouridine38-40 synthase